MVFQEISKKFQKCLKKEYFKIVKGVSKRIERYFEGHFSGFKG